MTENNIQQIRESIKLAREHEQQSHELERFLEKMSVHLHKSIDLPPEQPVAALLDFVIRYIENVPRFLQLLSQAMREAQVYEQGKVFLQIAQDFFLKPPEVVQNQSGLRALIDEAYLAHRLVEEVNDRLLFHCDAPLAPMDMTLANIVVHDLLGEDYANQLDLAVHYAVEALFASAELGHERSSVSEFIARHRQGEWQAGAASWHCLAGESAISLSLMPEAATLSH